MGEVEPLAGRVLADKYLLVSRLGEGGFGSIWRAVHQILKSEVAVKLIDLDMARKDGAVERFLREAQATAALRSPHVVQVLDYGVDGDQPFIVMELLEGENLADRIERIGPLPPLEVLRIVTHVARAMAKAHELGIVHRDLKPENIFLVVNGDEEVAKVLDFGVAKIASPVDLNQDTYTITGSLIGTPYYMSPEQAQGNKAVDHRSDLWALGVIAFEMITAKRPFDGDALGDLVLTICVRSIAVPSVVAQVPAGFDTWFAKAVERDPAARFQSAREMAIALLQIIEGDTDIRYTRTEDLANAAVAASPSFVAEIPSRPNASGFAATMRDEVSLGAASLMSAAPHSTSSSLGVAQSAGAFAGSTPTNFPSGDLVEEEQLTPWSLAGIAVLALAAGAAAVYGLFFLFRAHEASNDSSAPAATNLRPEATIAAPAANKHHFDVATTHRPNGNTEGTSSRSSHALHDTSGLPAVAASGVGPAPSPAALPSASPMVPLPAIPSAPVPLEPELSAGPTVVPLPTTPSPSNHALDVTAPLNPVPAFSADTQPMSTAPAPPSTPDVPNVQVAPTPRDVPFGAIAPSE